MNSSLRILLLLTAVSLGTAIKCFVCNSHENKDCYAMDGTATDKYLKDCDTLSQEDAAKTGGIQANYTLCRKLHMFLDQDFTEVNPAQDRVHRDCGYVEDNTVKMRHGNCYYKSGYNTRTWVCSCSGDECNAATTSAALPVTTLVAAAATVLAAQF